MTSAASARTVLAFDFGLKRIGVAVGQSITRSASPLTTLTPRDDAALRKEIASLVREWRPTLLLLGDPSGGTTSESLTEAIREFADMLRETGISLEHVDEAMSSAEASERLIARRRSGAGKRIRKTDIDAESARIIAERWLAADC